MLPSGNIERGRVTPERVSGDLSQPAPPRTVTRLSRAPSPGGWKSLLGLPFGFTAPFELAEIGLDAVAAALARGALLYEPAELFEALLAVGGVVFDEGQEAYESLESVGTIGSTPNA
jgi:hypothetical protein